MGREAGDVHVNDIALTTFLQYPSLPTRLPVTKRFSCVPVSLPMGAGGVSGMMGGMGMTMGDKTIRELFVGNTPQGTSDFVLLEFLNAAMKQVSSRHSFFISLYLARKFWFFSFELGYFEPHYHGWRVRPIF